MQNQTQNQTNINLNKLAGISQNEEMENLSFRFYPEEYPDEGDYVMFIPTYEIESGVMGTLPEYNHIEAFIVQTEYSASSVKSFHKLFKIGRIETCLVLSVDKFKGYIDLSRKKANNQEEIEILKSEFKKSKEVQLIMKQVMKKSQMDLETLYNKVVWPLYNGYDHPYDAFSRVRSDDQILQDLHLGNLSKIVHRAILKKIPFKQIRLEAKFELICYTYGGVEDLKKALMKAEKVGNKLNPLNIYLVAPPLYRIELITQNYDFGVELVKKALKKIREQTNQDEWKFKIVSDPIAINVLSKNDERILFEASLALISLKEKFKQEKIYQRALERSTFQMLYGNIHLMNQNMVYGQELVEMKNVQRSNEQIKVISGLKKDSAQEINDKKVETTNKSINESDNTKTGEEDKKINDFKRVSLGELKEFLHAKPRPPWSSRLESFYRYNPKLIVGWKTGFADTFMHSNLKDKSHKVIISKDLFTEFANLTKIADTKQAFLRVYKSSQRGVEEFFKKIGFVKIANYSREKVVFAYKK